jgi:hypothetical protein
MRPPHVAVGLSESHPISDAIFIVSFKSPSPANKLIKLAAKLIPAAAQPLHFSISSSDIPDE